MNNIYPPARSDWSGKNLTEMHFISKAVSFVPITFERIIVFLDFNGMIWRCRIFHLHNLVFVWKGATKVVDETQKKSSVQIDTKLSAIRIHCESFIIALSWRSTFQYPPTATLSAFDWGRIPGTMWFIMGDVLVWCLCELAYFRSSNG